MPRVQQRTAGVVVKVHREEGQQRLGGRHEGWDTPRPNDGHGSGKEQERGRRHAAGSVTSGRR